MGSKQLKDKNEFQISSNNKTFELFHQSIDKYFKNVSVNTATYLQSVSDLQQEIIESRKKNAESVIVLQKIITDKLNSNIKVPYKSLKIITGFTEQTNKAWNFQNQLMLKSIDSLTKNIQAFNENADTQFEMNKKIIESWAAIIKQSKNNKD